MYVPSTRKRISSYYVVFDESFSSALAYASQPYSEAMAMRLTVTYTPYGTSSREQTGYIITFTQFEEGNILTKAHNDEESSKESKDESIMPPLLNAEKMYAMDYRHESDHDHISTGMLEKICDGSKSHPSIIRRKARYKIRDIIKEKKLEWKGALKATRNMGKGLQKIFKTVVKEIYQDLPPLG